MTNIDTLLKLDLNHRGVQFTPPNDRSITCDGVDLSNVYTPEQGKLRYGVPRSYIGGVYHSTEDRADANDQAVYWFNDPRANASTDWYVSADGDIWHMVPTGWYAWAQGTRTKPWHDAKGNLQKPTDRYVINNVARPDWMSPAPTSYNAFLTGIEIEGYANNLHNTLAIGGKQWQSLAYLSGWIMWTRGWDGAERWLRHMDLSTWKSDPGAWFGEQMPKLYEHSITVRDNLEQRARVNANAEAAHAAATTALENRVSELESEAQQTAATIRQIDGWVKSYPNVA